VTPAEAARRLAEAGVPDPQRDARLLFEWAMAEGGNASDTTTQARFSAAIDQRAARWPVSRITGRRAFWKHDFMISEAVLDPRPDTETLVEIALGEAFASVLDLGTGSGCILLSLLAERPDARGLGTDVSAAALDVARRNAARLGVSNASFMQSDWFSAVEGRFDLIVSNPPYIAASDYAGLGPEVRFDPQIALTPGGDGLDPYRVISRAAGRHLNAGGRLLTEIGHDQGEAVAGLFAEAGLADVTVHPDINRRDRVVAARRA
jgi:release factor glutamine methyltransferase